MAPTAMYSDNETTAAIGRIDLHLNNVKRRTQIWK